MEEIQVQLDHILLIVQWTLGVTCAFFLGGLAHGLMMRSVMKVSNARQSELDSTMQRSNEIGTEQVGLLRNIDIKLGLKELQ